MTPSAETVLEWMHTVEASRMRYEVSVDERIRALGRVGELLANPESQARRRAVAELPVNSGLSAEMASYLLDRMAETWKPAALAKLWDQEFPTRTAQVGRREPAVARPLSPQLHIGPGSVPGVTLTSALRGLLTGAAVVTKPGEGDWVLTRVGREILGREHPSFAERWVAAYWPGSLRTAEKALQAARMVVIYGDDRTVATYRGAVPAGVPVVAYGHRASAAVVDAAMTDEASGSALAAAVAAYDRRGCVSPQVAYVVGEGGDGVDAWCGQIAGELAALEARLPAGRRTPGEAVRSLQRVGDLELRAAAGESLAVWSDRAARWCVASNRTGSLLPMPDGRAIQVMPMPGIGAVQTALRAWAPHLQSVGLRVPAAHHQTFEVALRDAGALRVVDLADMPWPPAWWRHDGRMGLRPLMALETHEQGAGAPPVK